MNHALKPENLPQHVYVSPHFSNNLSIYLDVLFVVAIDWNKQCIFDKTNTKNHIIVVIMFQNRSYMYSSHYNTIIKFISFELIYYGIILSVFSYLMVFSDLIFMFLSMYY